MNRNRTKNAIIILSFLLAVSAVALLITLFFGGKAGKVRTSSSSGNRIGNEEKTEISFDFVSEGDFIVLCSNEDVPEEEMLTLSEAGKTGASAFNVSGFFPGDSFEKNYVLKIKGNEPETLIFSAALTKGNVPGDKLKLKVEAGGSILYYGQFGTVDDTPLTLNGKKTAEYKITVSLDKEAGKEYSGLDLGITFKWKYSYEETPVYAVKYSDGVTDAEIFPDETYYVKEGRDTPDFSSVPEREGFVFKGWYPEVSDKVTGNVTYTAQWAVTVSLNINGEIVTVLVDEGKKMDRPAVPVKEKCGFSGWYSDEALTEKFDFDTPLTSNVSLYAGFFLWGDVDGNGIVTSADADLINLFVMEADSPNMKNITAGRVSGISGSITSNDANEIVRYVMEYIDVFPSETLGAGYEFDLESNTVIIP